MSSSGNTHLVSFIALFGNSNREQQLKCLLTDKENMVYSYSELLFGHKEAWNVVAYGVT